MHRSSRPRPYDARIGRNSPAWRLASQRISANVGIPHGIALAHRQFHGYSGQAFRCSLIVVLSGSRRRAIAPRPRILASLVSRLQAVSASSPTPGAARACRPSLGRSTDRSLSASSIVPSSLYISGVGTGVAIAPGQPRASLPASAWSSILLHSCVSALQASPTPGLASALAIAFHGYDLRCSAVPVGACRL